jgi:hypothetical protein
MTITASEDAIREHGSSRPISSISGRWRLEHDADHDPPTWVVYPLSAPAEPWAQIRSSAVPTRAALWGWLVQAGIAEDDADLLTQRVRLEDLD